MRQDEFEDMLSKAVLSSALAISDERQLLYPDFDIVTKTATVGVAYVAQVTAVGVSREMHTVVVCYSPVHSPSNGEPEFSARCDDKFLAGKLAQCEAEARAAKAVYPGLKLYAGWGDSAAIKSAVASGGQVRAELMKQLMSQHNIYPEDASCDFWAMWRRRRQVCSHVSHVLAHLKATQPDFQQVMRQRYADAQLEAINSRLVDVAVAA
jgi:hypothetical protein